MKVLLASKLCCAAGIRLVYGYGVLWTYVPPLSILNVSFALETVKFTLEPPELTIVPPF